MAPRPWCDASASRRGSCDRWPSRARSSRAPGAVTWQQQRAARPYAAPILPDARHNPRLVRAAVLLACALGLWSYLRYAGPLPGDVALLQRAQAHPALLSSHLLQFLGILGTTSVALVTVVVAAAIVGRAIGLLAAAAVLASSGGVVLNEVLRALLGPTPTSEATFGALVESYPSGHVVYATTVFGILAWLSWMHGRRDAAAVLAGLIVAMGPGRVLAGVHLPSDVLGSYLLGGAWLLIVLTAHDAARARPGACVRMTQMLAR